MVNFSTGNWRQYRDSSDNMSRSMRFPTMWYVRATSKASDHPAHTHSLIRAFACHLNILWFLSLTGGCTGSSESTLVKMPHCCKSHATAHICPHPIICGFDKVNDNYIKNSTLSALLQGMLSCIFLVSMYSAKQRSTGQLILSHRLTYTYEYMNYY